MNNKLILFLTLMAFLLTTPIAFSSHTPIYNSVDVFKHNIRDSWLGVYQASFRSRHKQPPKAWNAANKSYRDQVNIVSKALKEDQKYFNFSKHKFAPLKLRMILYRLNDIQKIAHNKYKKAFQKGHARSSTGGRSQRLFGDVRSRMQAYIVRIYNKTDLNHHAKHIKARKFLKTYMGHYNAFRHRKDKSVVELVYNKKEKKLEVIKPAYVNGRIAEDIQNMAIRAKKQMSDILNELDVILKEEVQNNPNNIEGITEIIYTKDLVILAIEVYDVIIDLKIVGHNPGLHGTYQMLLTCILYTGFNALGEIKYDENKTRRYLDEFNRDRFEKEGPQTEIKPEEESIGEKTTNIDEIVKKVIVLAGELKTFYSNHQYILSRIERYSIKYQKRRNARKYKLMLLYYKDDVSQMDVDEDDRETLDALIHAMEQLIKHLK